MEIQLPIALQMKIAVFLLALIRITGLFMITPFLAAPSVPARVKALLALGITVCVAPLLWSQGEGALLSLQEPIMATLTVLSELSIGLIIGFTVGVVIAAIQTAGQFVAHDIGMTIANTIDPLSNRQISLVGQFKATLAIVLFLALDLHHQMVRLVSKSFELVPVGTFVERSTSFNMGLAEVTRYEGSRLFSTAAQLAVPVTITLLLVTVAMAFLARSVPEINVFILGFAIRIIVGFSVIVVILPMLSQMYQLFLKDAVTRSWELFEAVVGS